jgi:uncharacterized protein (DUF1697 family)
MKNCIVLLRGVNVGGRVVPMARLRDSLASLGCEAIQTYIQSGNVVLRATETSASFVAKIEARLADDFGFPISVLLRTVRDLERVIADNPFAAEKDTATSRLHVTFLAQACRAGAQASLESIAAGNDRFHFAAKQIYLDCPDGYGRTKLTNNVIEKKLGVVATTRNWNTVLKLLTMANGLAE